MAERLGVSHQFINQICQGIKKLPPKDVLTVEKATDGKVTRHELRPDIFGEAE